MKRILGFGLLLWAAVAQATTWTPVKASSCTGLNAPSGCCVVAAPGANPGCIMRNTAGQLFVVRADLLSDGGTYTLGGDALTSANFAALGLQSILWANCTVSDGHDIVILPDPTGKAPKFKLFTAVATEQTAAAIAATVWLTCDFYGR